MTTRSRSAVATAAVSVAVALAACGSSSSTSSSTKPAAGAASTKQSGSEAPSGATTSLTIGTSPTISNASLYYAIDDGPFAAHKLKGTPVVIQSGAEAIPQVLNGQVQFSASDPLSALLAIAHGTPIEMVVGGNVAASSQATDPSALIVKDDSPIKDLAELDGHTVAVNAINSLGQVGLEAAVDATGGHSSTIKFVEVAFPDMVAAVKNGTVDGAATNEPFVTLGKSQGQRIVPRGGLSTTLAGVPQVLYVTSKSYAQSHPSVVAAFAAAVDAGDQALSKDPSEIRQIGAKSTTLPPPVLAKITLPTFGPPLTVASLEKLEKYMVKYKVLSAPIPDLSQYVYSGS